MPIRILRQPDLKVRRKPRHAERASPFPTGCGTMTQRDAKAVLSAGAIPGSRNKCIRSRVSSPLKKRPLSQLRRQLPLRRDAKGGGSFTVLTVGAIPG